MWTKVETQVVHATCKRRKSKMKMKLVEVEQSYYLPGREEPILGRPNVCSLEPSTTARFPFA